MDLPADVWRRILGYLAPRDLNALSRTSRALNRACVDKGALGPLFAKAASHAVRRNHVTLLERLLSSHSALFLREATLLMLLQEALGALNQPAAQAMLRLMRESPKVRCVRERG